MAAVSVCFTFDAISPRRTTLGPATTHGTVVFSGKARPVVVVPAPVVGGEDHRGVGGQRRQQPPHRDVYVGEPRHVARGEPALGVSGEVDVGEVDEEEVEAGRALHDRLVRHVRVAALGEDEAVDRARRGDVLQLLLPHHHHGAQARGLRDGEDGGHRDEPLLGQELVPVERQLVACGILPGQHRGVGGQRLGRRHRAGGVREGAPLGEAPDVREVRLGEHVAPEPVHRQDRDLGRRRGRRGNRDGGCRQRGRWRAGATAGP